MTIAGAKSPCRFDSILVANRGEIACRVIKTARRLGYRTIAVYSDVDRYALHMQLADMAVALDDATAQNSYLDIEKIIAVCRQYPGTAVHPGYGFLSESADFARRCEQEQIVFIGPSSTAIQQMGSKSIAKQLMADAGVPCIAGYQGGDQSNARLIAEAQRIGFPLMIKAAAGGGGRGMRLAENADLLPALLESARAESEKAFGSGELLLERALIGARHIEVQVFGDVYGNVVHLGERDCSIQRRHQKVFEESPSPVVDDNLRTEMGKTAVLAARSIGYVGAGTVEFLLDREGSFYFLEMNTRLQVEHPVTELITGVDLVEWQIEVANGRPLPVTQESITFSGHAIEARLCAEDPQAQFQPAVGDVLLWEPAAPELARVDHGLNAVDKVSSYYDSMLAKVIAHGPDRESASRRLLKALSETTILGVKTNREFLMHCLAHEEFKACRTDTSFIERIWTASVADGAARKRAAPATEITDELFIGAALWLCRDFVNATGDTVDWTNTSKSELFGWSNSKALPLRLRLLDDRNRECNLEALYKGSGTWQMKTGGTERAVQMFDCKRTQATFVIDGITSKVRFAFNLDELFVASEHRTVCYSESTFARKKLEEEVAGGMITAPSDGVIHSIDVEVGQVIHKGARLCTLESMKLMRPLCATVSGIIKRIAVSTGKQVSAKQFLFEIEPAGGSSGEIAIPATDKSLCKVVEV